MTETEVCPLCGQPLPPKEADRAHPPEYLAAQIYRQRTRFDVGELQTMSWELSGTLGDEVYHGNLPPTRNGLLEGILRVAREKGRMDLVVRWIKYNRPDVARTLGWS